MSVSVTLAMLGIVLWGVYLSVFAFIVGLFPLKTEDRPRLRDLDFEAQNKKKPSLFKHLKRFIRVFSQINRPLAIGIIRQRMIKDLAMAQLSLVPEELFLIKEAAFIAVLALTYPIVQPDIIVFWILMSFAFGYYIPEMWLRGKIKKVKNVVVKELPDAIDLLGLCVNAGLDFMLALKWVIEKSPPSVFINELNIVMQEINVGKTRRDALKDMATKFELPDLSTFSRTLIQADKMGTSVNEALNILSEDMRLARFRRGEQMALKAPLKMLVPLLLCIFPVVGILVAAPILLDFMQNNPMKKLTQ